ncbi:alpha/beta fold hydrolase [Pseudonocardia lacus]|uniref:alpha/beta fold hydrolase n=1 Tax=Pseudonocardia lacus TaxID=2835865 RepID=UPI001BDCD475|nr:alpha/beta hydrolase [Pseudonocardia lacus]
MQTVRIDDGAELCVDVQGDGAAPLLLLGGATWSMDWWDDELCARFVARGHRVIRYDPRDTGRSTAYPPGAPGYTATDLRTDAVAVLDHLGVGRAHVAGLSMGGGIAQELAARFPDRVASLTLISTSPTDPSVTGLPGPTPRITELPEPDEPDWTDPAAVVEYVVEAERPYAGPGSFDERWVRATATRAVGRSRDMRSCLTNHFAVIGGDDSPPVPLADLAGVPTLVVHGTADPLLPVEHGRALAAGIPDARLLELTDVGHQLPPPRTWDQLVEAMVANRDRAVARR